jgi:myb proto-oncogene protein
MRTNPEDGQESYSHHTAVQCMCRYKNVLDVCVRKGPWTEEEDDILRNLVKAAPIPHKIKWREVAEHLSGRLGKQCRERWFHYYLISSFYSHI